MKAALMIAVAAFGLALCAYGQASIDINNGSSAHGLAIIEPGNWYEGTYGFEIWYQNGTSFPLYLVNSFAGEPGGGGAYDFIDDWTLAATFTDVSNTGFAGFMQVGPINIPGVTPAGSTITMALAAWVGAHDTWIAAGQANEHRGVVAFHTATVNYNLEPPPTPPDISAGWTAAGVDLIMNAWPEPSSLSLMALGLGALLIRRRK